MGGGELALCGGCWPHEGQHPVRVVSGCQDISTRVETSSPEPRGPEVTADLGMRFLSAFHGKFVVLHTSNPETSELRPGGWRGMSSNFPARVKARMSGEEPSEGGARGRQEGLRVRGRAQPQGLDRRFWEGRPDGPATACSQPSSALSVTLAEKIHKHICVQNMRCTQPRGWSQKGVWKQSARGPVPLPQPGR